MVHSLGLIKFAMNYYCSQLNLVLTSFGKSLTQVKIFAYIDVLNGMQCQFKEIQKVLKRLDCRSLPRSLQRESLEVLSLSSSMSSSSTPSSRCPPFIAIVNNSSIYIISKKKMILTCIFGILKRNFSWQYLFQISFRSQRRPP